MRRRACIATRIRAANARETGFRRRAEQAGKRGISDPFKQSSRVRGIARAPPRAFALRAIETRAGDVHAPSICDETRLFKRFSCAIRVSARTRATFAQTRTSAR
jgi:hypothetical protein